MKYIVKRASQWGDKHQPCKEAVKEFVDYKNGKEEVWAIEIESLEALMKFKDKYGDIVIGDSIIYKGYSEILIYDDYIE